MSATSDPWASFGLDPRDAAHASLRSAERDRDLIGELLRDAYAEGRLDRAELDERTDALNASRTLGELPPLVADLVAPTPVPGGSVVARGSARSELARATPADLERMAHDHLAARLRSTVGTLIWTSVVCWVIWAVTDQGFVWPVFVSAALLLPVVKTVGDRRTIVAQEVRRLEKKQRRALKPPDQPMGDLDAG